MKPNNLLHRLEQFIKTESLFTKKDTLLIGVSGGKDSMLLLHLLYHLGYSIVIAHVNYGLRGKDADLDEALVNETAVKLNIPIVIYRVTEKERNAIDSESVQMWARNIRYTFFKTCAETYSCNRILTAHHGGDQSETLIQHLVKGAGISGLRGMLPLHLPFARPMLCYSLDEILFLCQRYSIVYRDDISNKKNDYERNKIRNNIIPILKEINPNLDKSIFYTTQYLKGTETIYKAYITKRLNKLIQHNTNKSKAPAAAMANDKMGLNLLFEWLYPYGFNSTQLIDIYQHCKAKHSGKDFYSETHQVIVDRTYIYLELKGSKQQEVLYVSSIPYKGESDTKTILIQFVDSIPKTMDNTNIHVFLDAEKITLPLIVRSWQEGDYMYPLGMKMKKKKLSDMFSNKKIPKHLKRNHWILTSGNHIVFAEGLAIDERHKITEHSKRFIEIKIDCKP